MTKSSLRHETAIGSAALSPEGRHLATGSWVGDDYDAGGTIQVWEVASGRSVNVIEHVDGGVGWPGHDGMLRWRPDGKLLGAVFETSSIGGFDPFSSKKAPRFAFDPTDGADEPVAFAWSPKGDVIFAATGPSPIPGTFVDVSSRKPRSQSCSGALPRGQRALHLMRDVAFAGDTVVGFDGDRTIWAVDAATRKLRWVREARAPFAIHPSGAWFVARGPKGMQRHDTRTGEPDRKRVWPTRARIAVFGAAGDLALVGSKSVLVVRASGETVEVAARCAAADGRELGDFVPWAFSGDGARAASLDDDGKITVFSLSGTARRERTLSAPGALGLFWGVDDVIVAIGEETVTFARATGAAIAASGPAAGAVTKPVAEKPRDRDAAADVLLGVCGAALRAMSAENRKYAESELLARHAVIEADLGRVDAAHATLDRCARNDWSRKVAAAASAEIALLLAKRKDTTAARRFANRAASGPFEEHERESMNTFARLASAFALVGDAKNARTWLDRALAIPNAQAAENELLIEACAFAGTTAELTSIVADIEHDHMLAPAIRIVLDRGDTTTAAVLAKSAERNVQQRGWLLAEAHLLRGDFREALKLHGSPEKVLAAAVDGGARDATLTWLESHYDQDIYGGRNLGIAAHGAMMGARIDAERTRELVAVVVRKAAGVRREAFYKVRSLCALGEAATRCKLDAKPVVNAAKGSLEKYAVALGVLMGSRVEEPAWRALADGATKLARQVKGDVACEAKLLLARPLRTGGDPTAARAWLDELAKKARRDDLVAIAIEQLDVDPDGAAKTIARAPKGERGHLAERVAMVAAARGLVDHAASLLEQVGKDERARAALDAASAFVRPPPTYETWLSEISLSA